MKTSKSICFVMRGGSTGATTTSLHNLLKKAHIVERFNCEIGVWHPENMGVEKQFEDVCSVRCFDPKCHFSTTITKIGSFFFEHKARLLWHLCNKILALFTMVRLWRYAKGFDLVVVWHQSLLCRYAFRTLSHKRLIFWYHDSKLDDECSGMHFRGVKAVVALTSSTKNLLVSEWRVHPDKCYVIPNLFDREIIRSNRGECPVAFRKKKNIILTLGRFSWEKGIDLVLDAVLSMHKKGFTDFTWFLIGGGDWLRDKALEEPFSSNVALLAFDSNPYPYIAHCDLFVSPSKFESFGMAMGEAAVLGKPILATNTAGGNYWVDDGVNGMKVGFDADELADACIRFFTNNELRKELQRGAVAAAAETRFLETDQKAINSFRELLGW